MDISQDTNLIYFFLFLISILASFIDSIAGGGGLLTTPSMLLVGINPLTVPVSYTHLTLPTIE